MVSLWHTEVTENRTWMRNHVRVSVSCFMIHGFLIASMPNMIQLLPVHGSHFVNPSVEINRGLSLFTLEWTRCPQGASAGKSQDFYVSEILGSTQYPSAAGLKSFIEQDRDWPTAQFIFILLLRLQNRRGLVRKELVAFWWNTYRAFYREDLEKYLYSSLQNWVWNKAEEMCSSSQPWYKNVSKVIIIQRKTLVDWTSDNTIDRSFFFFQEIAWDVTLLRLAYRPPEMAMWFTHWIPQT